MSKDIVINVFHVCNQNLGQYLMDYIPLACYFSPLEGYKYEFCIRTPKNPRRF